MDEVGKLLVDEFDHETLSYNFVFNSNGEITASSIRNCLSISSKNDTSVIKVTAYAKNPEVAAYICNALTKVAPEYMMEAVGVGSINTIGQAKTYYNPVSPNIFNKTASGALVGFIVIVVIVIMVDYFDNTIKDVDTLTKRYHKAIIGEIRELTDYEQRKKLQLDSSRHFKLLDKDIPLDIVESFKSIRTNVTFSLSTNERKIFCVSSANRGEGKSTVTANIAIAMAQNGSKVLLIDADMRKSVQHIIFNLKNDKGLSTAAGKMNPLEECIQKNVMENLDVLTAGPTPANPSELLASEQMTNMLDELSSQYNVIIIDTPPINVVTDTIELAQKGCGIIIVVRYGITTDEEIKTANQKLEFANVNMLGYVLNGIMFKHYGGYYGKSKRRRGVYFKRGYGSGYGYGYVKEPEAEVKPKAEADQNEQTEPSEQVDQKEKPDQTKKDNQTENL